MLTLSENRRMIVLAVLFGLDIILFMLSSLSAAYHKYLICIGLTTLILSVGWFYRVKRPDPKLAIGLIGTGQFVAFTLACALLNHLLIDAERPLIDQTLVEWDAVFGFYWPSIIEWVSDYPFLMVASSLAYQSSLVQVVLVVLLMAFGGLHDRLNRYLDIFMFCGIFTVGFWAIFPSFGSLAYYVQAGVISELHNAVVDISYVNALFDLRNGYWGSLDPDQFKGLIAFPSFHTVMAVLTIYAVWGMRFVFWPVFLLNLLVLFSVIVDGGHHLVDLFAGVTLSLVAIAVAEGWFSKVWRTFYVARRLYGTNNVKGSNQPHIMNR